jgi:hypothetical protein
MLRFEIEMFGFVSVSAGFGASRARSRLPSQFQVFLKASGILVGFDVSFFGDVRISAI